MAQGYGSNLGRYAPLMRDPDENGAHKLAARKWREDGTLVLQREIIDRLDWQDRELVNAIGARIYGPRED